MTPTDHSWQLVNRPGEPVQWYCSVCQRRVQAMRYDDLPADCTRVVPETAVLDKSTADR